MRNVALILIALCLSTTAFCKPANSSALPWEHLPKMGEGKLKVMFWNIYNAALYAEESDNPPDRNFALALTYLRDIRAKNLVKETEKQLLKTSGEKSETISTWMAKIRAMWPDVKKGDSLLLYVDENKKSIFYLNGIVLGEIHGTDFSTAFSGIWLSENTTQPKLRAALLGK